MLRTPSWANTDAGRIRVIAGIVWAVYGVMSVWVADCCAAAPDTAAPLVAYRIGNGEIRDPLTREPGDAKRGRAAVLSRDAGNCFLCHAVPAAENTPLGNIGPSLAGVGARLTAAQLRLRLVDSTRINSRSVMPAYYRTRGLHQVAPAYRDRPLLTAQQIEDVIAYLLTLTELSDTGRN
jgi:L-cysteine S-thiosulfotransferase